MQSEKERKNAFLALLEDAPQQAALCAHVSEGCGGCLLQEHSYEQQLKAKERFLEQVYGYAVPIIPCDDHLGYRNRMDFVAAFGKVGLRKRGKFAHVVDVKDCMLLPEHARSIYAKVRALLCAAGVKDYNYVRHEGFLRYVVIRTSQTTKETMVILTTVEPKEEEKISYEKIFTEIYQQTGVTSLHWTTNSSMSDMSVGILYWHIGNEFIVDEIAGCRFRITPATFFQANTAMAGVLFAKAISFAEGRVLDLYCGVGVISILAARSVNVTSVTGVEVNEQSVKSARENLSLNIAKAPIEFICSDAYEYLRTAEPFETVICDPARPGLGIQACDQLLRIKPKRIIYISCNPLTHKQDITMLSGEYAVTHMKAYDLFAQTPHVEILSVLERRG
jgi:23S rRNA (uracil1939-C5)-methyltransferase